MAETMYMTKIAVSVTMETQMIMMVAVLVALLNMDMNALVETMIQQIIATRSVVMVLDSTQRQHIVMTLITLMEMDATLIALWRKVLNAVAAAQPHMILALKIVVME